MVLESNARICWGNLSSRERPSGAFVLAANSGIANTKTDPDTKTMFEEIMTLIQKQKETAMKYLIHSLCFLNISVKVP